MQNNLRLYNSRLTIRLDKKEKETLKKNAYKNKLKLSEYIRLLILIDNRKNDMYNQLKKIDKSIKEIDKANIRIRRDD